MRRRVALLLLVATACSDSNTEFARAFRTTNRAQLIGGVAAVADVGDYMLENDQVRVVILGGHGSPGPGIFGGTLADADLQRPQARFRGGNGLDAFSELFPMVNLATPNPDGIEVRIANDGSSGPEAVISVDAMSDNYMDALEMLETMFKVPMTARIKTDYRLAPGSRVVKIDSTLEFNPSGTPPADFVAMPGLQSPPDVFGTILRVGAVDQPTRPGAVVGDFLFYGNKTDVFTPDYGFDFELKLREIFNGGCDTINVPVGVEAIAAEADGVSYAYASADEAGGKTYVPLFASSFTAVMTHVRECTSGADCLRGVNLTYSRLFAIGDGDAASALGALYEEKGVATGRISGHLYDQLDGTPVSLARVLVVKDPGVEVIGDADLGTLSANESLARIYAANRDASKKTCPPGDTCAPCAAQLDPYGSPGIVTSMKTDRRADDKVLDGDFEARLPPGSYLLVARDRNRATAKPVRIAVEENKETKVRLGIGAPATVEVHVVDERGEPIPAKVTLGRCLPRCALDADCPSPELACDAKQRRCLPRSGTCAGDLCRSYESCEGGACACNATSSLDVAMGDPLMPDNIFASGFAGADGIARLSARPGPWELIVSRGPEYDLSFHEVVLEPRRPLRVNASVRRVVDTTGWVSADFHVHGINSHDANVDHDTRVLSMMGEGIELVSSSDHDAMTDFGPSIRKLGAQRFIKGQVGLEASTIELGHFIGAPLRYDQLSTGANVAGTPRENDDVLVYDETAMPGTGGAFDWDGLPPTEIMERLRQLGLFGPEKTVVTVAHPRDGFFGYFDQYALDPFTLELGPAGSALELLNPLVKPEFFDASFNAIELFNGKRLDFVRTPTVGELAGFGADMQALRARGLPNSELEREQAFLGDRWVREILKRTPEEQDAIISDTGRGTSKPCAEGPGPACQPGWVCHPDTSLCVAGPNAPSRDHNGVIDDWFRLLNGGVKITGLGNSDTHDLINIESGLPRNWVRSSTDEPRAIDVQEIAASVLGHQSLASYGPFIRLDVNGTGVGGTVSNVTEAVKVRVSVQSPLWFDVDRLELYRNGRLWKEVEAGSSVEGCAVVDSVPNKQVVNFDCVFEDAGSEDAWFVAMAMGLRGKDLRPVYTSVPILALEIGDITGRAFDAIEGFPVEVGRPEIPRQHPVLPYAITNPVWVDRAGDGFDPPVPLSPMSPFADRASKSFPLTSARIGHTPLPELEEPPEKARPKRLVEQLQRRLLRAFGHSH